MEQSVIILLVCGLITCSAAPGKTVDSNDIPKLQLSGDSVSASFGGYHASAGLGGSLEGGPSGGLFAQAGTPDGTSASAALSGSVGKGGALSGKAGVASTVSATENHAVPPHGRPNDFFDNVFNIPISVLQAVSQLLGGTPKDGGTKAVNTRTTSTANSASSAHTGGDAYGSNAPPQRTFFDDIFNIPISALKSVNEFLNGKNQGERRPVRL